MAKAMLALLQGLKRNINHWVMTTEPLLSPATPGDTILHVRSAKRFKTGDEFLIRDENETTENNHYVEQVIDDTHLKLTEPVQFAWPLNKTPSIVRTFYGQFFKAVHIGEPDVISLNELPAITIWGTGRNSEPLAIRTSKERYNIEIGVYVADGTLESGVNLLLDSTDLIQTGLKRNLYPLVNDYETTIITEDTAIGDRFIKVPDTSKFNNRYILILENDLYTQEVTVDCIADATTLKIRPGCEFAFAANNTTVILPNRFIYNSWPADINYSKIHKGTLMKAAVINYFAEEAEDQFVSSWFDTQLK